LGGFFYCEIWFFLRIAYRTIKEIADRASKCCQQCVFLCGYQKWER